MSKSRLPTSPPSLGGDNPHTTSPLIRLVDPSAPGFHHHHSSGGVVIAALLALATSSCATTISAGCKLPELSNAEVTAIADAFLRTKSMNEDFRRSAERRVTVQGCQYEYEEAEKLDSFGAGIVVVVDRRRKVIDFYSSH